MLRISVKVCVSLLVALGMVCLIAPRPIVAQEITGGITGTVTDPSGAAIPGAKVTATNVAQGTVWPTETNAAGVYNFPRLPIGEYKVTVTAQGFATSVHPPFELQMNQIARVDSQLKVGSMTQTVSVTAAPPLLQTDTMQVGMVTSANFNVNLPLATRNFIQLTLLAPGVTTPDPSSFKNGQRTGGGGRPYVNGNREEANNFLLDGVNNNQISDNLTSYQPSPDAIQEFNVITNNAPAQYGQFQGGVISVTLKSGTDQFHGDVFEYLRNDALNANNWARDWLGETKPGLRWNTFGGTVGGPIKKDKLFFFADYEGERLDNPPVTSFFTVMTAQERLGDFSQLLTEQGTQLYNPCASFSGPCTAPANPEAVRLPFVNNQIPASMMDPVAQKLFASKFYPAPVNTALQYNQFNTSHSFTDNDQGDIKVDFVVNDSNHLWGSYSEGFQQIPGTNTFPLLSQSFNNSPFHGGVIDLTHTISPTMVVDMKMGVNRILLHNGANVVGVGNLAQQLGIGSGNVHGPGLLALNMASGIANSIGTSDSEELFADTTLEPEVDLIITHDRHVIHVGFNAQRQAINTYYSGNNGKYGLMDYSGQYTSGPNPTNLTIAGSSKGFSEADFFLGLPNTVGLGVAGGTWGQRSWVLGTYIQDNWRTTRHLTLNLGLRWQYNQPWIEAFARQANFSPFSGVQEFASAANVGVCPLLMPAGNCVVTNSGAVYNQYYKDFEPRIGFAWTPGFLGKSTVVRGAYTISSFLEGTGTNLRLPLNPPFQSEFENDYTTGNLTYFPGSTTDQGLSVLASPSNPYANTNIRLWDPNVRPDQVQQWSFGIEHQFPGEMLLSVAYVGQHGTHLMVPMPYFQRRLVGEDGCTSATAVFLGKSTIPTCGSPYLAGNAFLYNTIGQISGTESNGDQAYDALQVGVTKHLTKGLEFQLSYAYSKAMTNAIGYYGEGGQAASNSAYWQNLYNSVAEWGPTYFDNTHNFVFSYVYQLPYGAGKRFGNKANPVARAVLGDWQISGIFTDHTGLPITITGPDNSGTKSRGAKANCIAPITYGHNVGPNVTWFNASSFTTSVAGTFGNCANGSVRGPGLRDWDVGAAKNIPITESKRLQFNAQFINLTNTPAFSAPNRSVTSTLFGQIRGSQGERNIQFGLKFDF